jgi:hypothetical protein
MVLLESRCLWCNPITPLSLAYPVAQHDHQYSVACSNPFRALSRRVVQNKWCHNLVAPIITKVSSIFLI